MSYKILPKSLGQLEKSPAKFQHFHIQIAVFKYTKRPGYLRRMLISASY